MRKAQKAAALIFILLISSLAIAGCAAPVYTLSPDFPQNKPHSIAILPVLNETNDLDAHPAFQHLIYRAMRRKRYQLIGPGEVKSLLAKKDIHEAGQMFSLTYPELGELLGADALLYCTVTDWSSLYWIVYSDVTVEAKFELIHASTGNRLWEATHKSSKIRFGLDDNSLSETLLNATFSPYEPIANVVVKESLDTLP